MKFTTLNRLFFVCGFLIFSGVVASHTIAQTQIDIPSPQPGGESFGRQVAVLPNGNFVVTDPLYDAPGAADAGRVYLYNGNTLALINTLTGTAANDSVGSNFSGRGIFVLTGGDYVITSSAWNGNRGAVTKCSASTGCPATITAANSLTGTTIGNNVGGDGVMTLPNGNFVVRSSAWDNGAVSDVGAITWCSSATGCAGITVSAANSRIGSTASDLIGLIGIVVLSNGNYVSQDLLWDNGAAANAGAVTFCSGAAICTGAVSTANSLIGTTANEFTGNQGIYPLTNGNYVVANDLWDNGGATDAGAATFCSGTTGCTATVSQANSLFGSTANDHVGLNGITALSNGNYVVRSSIWDNSGTTDVGAATFCNGTSGCANTAVSAANSLIGSSASDGVGTGAIALTNSNYVINSSDWDNIAASEMNVGASTWCSGTTGCTGFVTVGNSLIGQTQGDIAAGFAVALTNGNYVVISQNWLNPSNLSGGAGAVTFCNGSTGCFGEVTAANSLVGSSSGDNVGTVAALTNGNYVVTSSSWNNGAVSDVGAATLCSGTSGCTGAVSPANSLIGTTAGDQIGNFNPAPALPGGNYVVRSGSWDNGATTNVGAITRCGATGCTGTVSAANSLIGSTANDFVGSPAFGSITALANGNYVVQSGNWDNGGIVNAGAVSYGLGSGGTVGALTVNNSVRGTTAEGGSQQNFSFDAVNNQLVVGRPADNIVTVFRQAAPPTAASVTVSGRVLQFKDAGIADARVTITGANGTTRTTRTNRFGFYLFADVEIGQTYIVSVRHPFYSFNPAVLSLTEESLNVNLFSTQENSFYLP